MKISRSIIFLTLFVLLAPYFSLAQVAPPDYFTPPDIPTQLFSCRPYDSLRQCMLRLLGDVLRVILVLALAFAAIMIAWAGVTYIYKGADENARKASGAKLIYAAVGLVVAFLAWAIVAILSRVIGGGSFSI